MRKPHASITGSWATTKLVCMKHDPPKPMDIIEVRRQMVYACPDHEGAECKCNNFLSINDFNAMLDHINEEIVEGEMEDRIVWLTNTTWKNRNGVQFKVLEHTPETITVGVVNSKAFI